MNRQRRSKHFPFLTEYVGYALQWRPNIWSLPIALLILFLGIVSATIVATLVELFAVNGPFSLQYGLSAGLAAFMMYALGAYGVSRTRPRREADGQIQLKTEARQVAKRLELSLNKKRLHRDLSLETATLMEESARDWHRARTALRSPYWRRADLPNHLQAAREQSLLAVDQGMQEMLVLMSTSVPEQPGTWTFAEVVNEALGQDILTTPSRLDHLSPFYTEGKRVAQRLYDVADQVEAVSRRLAGEELIAGTPKPGTALEATLADLRQIEQAEQELRRDIRQ